MAMERINIDVEATDKTRAVFLEVEKGVKRMKMAIAHSMTMRGGWDSPMEKFAADIQSKTPVVVKSADMINSAVTSSFKTMDKELSGLTKHFRKGILTNGMTEIGDVIDNLDDQIAKSRRPFQGWALSVMFLGMQMQRTFSGLYKFGTKTFQEIAHSVEGTVTESDKLDGSMKYLGFTIGQALEPIVALIAPIVDWIADWVTENESLAAGLLATGVVLGTFLTVVGGGTLAISGLIEGFTKISTALTSLISGLIEGFTKISTSLTSLATQFPKVTAAFNVLKAALGAGIVLAVVLSIFGSDKEPTGWDWIKNLGLAAIGGFLAGGVAGAGIGVLLTLAALITKESQAQVLKDAERLRQLSQKVWSGTLTSKEAINNLRLLKFEGTTIPDNVGDYQKNLLAPTIAEVNRQVGVSNSPNYTININSATFQNTRDTQDFFNEVMKQYNLTNVSSSR